MVSELDDIRELASRLYQKTFTAPDGTPYLTRYLIKGDFGLQVGDPRNSIYLHHIHRPDYDRHLHSHPWKWSTSIVLHGGYTERRATEAMLEDGFLIPFWQSYNAGEHNLFVEGDYHSIIEVEPDTWTLFTAGPVIEDWFFWVDGVKVNSKEYLNRG